MVEVAIDKFYEFIKDDKFLISNLRTETYKWFKKEYHYDVNLTTLQSFLFILRMRYPNIACYKTILSSYMLMQIDEMVYVLLELLTTYDVYEIYLCFILRLFNIRLYKQRATININNLKILLRNSKHIFTLAFRLDTFNLMQDYVGGDPILNMVIEHVFAEDKGVVEFFM